ncbi:MAG: hypothetical protein PHV88_07110 [Eubacteriales bacterium]|nr:hypothetical protein [Eubacteriales bacterium]
MREATKTSCVIISVIMIFVILSSLAIFRTRVLVMRSLNSFSEVSLTDFSIGSGDPIDSDHPGYPGSKDDILKMLQTAVVENEDKMGFTAGPGAALAFIDPVATVHGVMLAKCVGFGINRSKLQNYINECYEKTEGAKQPADIINMLYYAIILDEQNNNYKISVSDDYVQKHVDRTVKALKFGNDINNDVVSARKAVEIVMDLQIHGRDIHLNMGQVRKIRRGIRKALDREAITDSVLLTDLYLVDHALGAGLVDEEHLVKAYDRTGGDCMYNAHRFMICFDRAGIDSYADEQVAYVRSNKERTLGSVFMGLSIVKHSNTGGMKE